jgi:hypothetical protein
MGVLGALLAKVVTEKVFHSSGIPPVSDRETLEGQQEHNEKSNIKIKRLFINQSGYIL